MNTIHLRHPTLRTLARRLSLLRLPLVEELQRRYQEQGFASARFCQHWCNLMDAEIEEMLTVAEPFVTDTLPDLIARGQLTRPIAEYCAVVMTTTPRLRGSLYGHLAVWMAQEQPLTADLVAPARFVEWGREPNSLIFASVTPLETFLANVPDLPGRTESNEACLHWLEQFLASTLACHPRK